MRSSAARRPDDGFATIWAAGAIAAMLVVFTVLIWVGAAAVTRHRATGAADLAALAAAAHARDGPSGACERAERVAQRMGARLKSCELHGWDALVEVDVESGGFLARFSPAVAKARAGPVDDGSAVEPR
jgi:secretion/DNA translocation related TadE-like protein